MKFTELKIKGAYLIEIEPANDERGFFVRSFCSEEFKQRSLEHEIKQTSISFNQEAGTIRGMHYQKPPHEEAKLILCTRGSIYDVLVDLRPDSRTFGQWVACELTDKNLSMIYAPKGAAHGFQTLESGTVVRYQMFEPYDSDSGAGIRYNDVRFGIHWPLEVSAISERDRTYPDFEISAQVT